MLHARHCITQKSETTLVSFAYRVSGIFPIYSNSDEDAQIGHLVAMFRSYIEFTRFDMPKHSA